MKLNENRKLIDKLRMITESADHPMFSDFKYFQTQNGFVKVLYKARFKGKLRLVCLMEGFRRQWDLYSCSRDGEPSDVIPDKYFNWSDIPMSTGNESSDKEANAYISKMQGRSQNIPESEEEDCSDEEDCGDEDTPCCYCEECDGVCYVDADDETMCTCVECGHRFETPCEGDEDDSEEIEIEIEIDTNGDVDVEVEDDDLEESDKEDQSGHYITCPSCSDKCHKSDHTDGAWECQYCGELCDGDGELWNNDDLEEEGRCWDGYRPVKGMKPYSKGSCVKIKEKSIQERVSEILRDKDL